MIDTDWYWLAGLMLVLGGWAVFVRTLCRAISIGADTAGADNAERQV